MRRRPHGFLPLAVIRNPTVVRGAAAAAAVPAAWFALLVAVPIVLVHEGWEPWQVGLVLVPSAVVSLVVPRIVAPTHARIGILPSLMVSGAIASIALVAAAIGTWLVAAPLLGLAVVMVSVAFGLGQPSLGAAVGEAVSAEVRGVALGVATLVFMVGGSVGSAVVAGLGDLLGIPASLALLALLPLAGLVLLSPVVRADRLSRVEARTISD